MKSDFSLIPSEDIGILTGYSYTLTLKVKVNIRVDFPDGVAP